MYRVTVMGDNVTARAAILACRQSGIDEFSWLAQAPEPSLPAHTLPANLTRILAALGRSEPLLELAYQPDREQIRFAGSGYLLSELPLGGFIDQRYSAPHLNLELAELLDTLSIPAAIATPLSSPTDSSPDGTLVVDTRTAPGQQPFTHDLWYARLANQGRPQHANITWLAPAATGWQFSTRQADHFFFSTPLQAGLERHTWHPSLGAAIESARHLRQFSALLPPPEEHWYRGTTAFLGPARLTENPYRREVAQLGLEDAWILGRMVENYEEDIADALAEFEKYRRARARRVTRFSNDESRQYRLTSSWQRLRRNLAIALRTRFLPEIAMQRIDWLYGFDCIRGFR